MKFENYDSVVKITEKIRALEKEKKFIESCNSNILASFQDKETTCSNYCLRSGFLLPPNIQNVIKTYLVGEREFEIRRLKNELELL